MMQEQILSKVAVSSPWGVLTVFCSDLGVAKVALPNENLDVDKYFKRYFGKYQVSETSSALAEFAKEELESFFAGKLKQFESPCDLRLTPFASRVLNELQQIPYGTTISYRDLALRCNNPRATRAVGWAMANNPIPLIIPCHRVINADGKLGSYGGGVQMKSDLLELEKQHR